MYYMVIIHVVGYGQPYYMVLLDGKIYADKPFGIWCVSTTPNPYLKLSYLKCQLSKKVKATPRHRISIIKAD